MFHLGLTGSLKSAVSYSGYSAVLRAGNLNCAAGKLRLLMNSAGRKAALAALILMLIMSVN